MSLCFVIGTLEDMIENEMLAEVGFWSGLRSVIVLVCGLVFDGIVIF